MKSHQPQSVEAELRKDIEARTRLMECMQDLIKGLGQANSDLAHELGVRRRMAGQLVGERAARANANSDAAGAEDECIAVTFGESTLLSLPNSNDWIPLPANPQNISSTDGSKKNGSLCGSMLATCWKPAPRSAHLVEVLSGLPGKRQAALIDLVVELVCREFAGPVLVDENLAFPSPDHPLGIVVSDGAGIIRLVNDRICKMTGKSASELVGRRTSDALFAPNPRAEPVPASTHLQSAEGWLKNGGTMSFPAKVLSRRIKSQTEDAGHVFVFMERAGLQERPGGLEPTGQRLLEGEFQKSLRMESIGRLAGEIAHDFDHLLLTIRGHAEMLDGRLPEGAGGNEALQQILSASDRATVLTRQLLAFSRRQILQPVPLNLNDVISGMSSSLQRMLGKHVELVANLDRELYAVLADRVQIERVLVNLASNAGDAMPEGGRLTVSTANVDCPETGLVGHDGLPPGDYVELTVRDTGAGMTEEVRAHLFEPFFSTKDRGEGIGMGLSAVHGIIKQSGGEIEACSEPGEGTTFKLFLPRWGADEHGVVSKEKSRMAETFTLDVLTKPINPKERVETASQVLSPAKL